MNYEFIITNICFHWKSDLFTKFLYYKNLDPYGMMRKTTNTFEVKILVSTELTVIGQSFTADIG